MAGLQRIYLVVGDASRGIYSYTWRIWWSGSSFYVKARDDAFADFKVSLHGPDAFHPRPGFIVGRDQSASPPEGTAYVERERFLGSRFDGVPVGDGALHVATLRFGAGLFRSGAPSAGGPAGVKDRPSNAARVAPPPNEGEVTDVRLYLGYERPYIPEEGRVRERNALLGPLRNRRDEYLTGVVYKNPADHLPSPSQFLGPVPRDTADVVRGFSATIDPSGFLWLEEQLLSRQHLLEHGTGASD